MQVNAEIVHVLPIPMEITWKLNSVSVAISIINNMSTYQGIDKHLFFLSY